MSGITLFSDLNLKSRRIRFISALSLCVGVGVTVWPFAFQDMRGSSYTAAFWECSDCSETMKGIRNGVSIFLSTGYCIGSVIAIVLNGILPEDQDETGKEGGDIHWSVIGAGSERFADSVKVDDNEIERRETKLVDEDEDREGSKGTTNDECVGDFDEA